ncbi:hypothetical protein LTR84_001763 [Exophiala bonariae]|uniref:Transcription factor domain-containing protein n=1 Tax=Exophiala bonariae TaxID=1690606 RepID=A0AAV9NF15_9EURO|nr:hypothetical protein LTR84_001763 [Exophiala bonariae]
MADTEKYPNRAESIQPLPWKEAGLPPSIAAHGVGQFDQDDMLLWHHFITCTSSTFSDPWTVDIPAVAISHHFLMQGILATAALHLAYLQPPHSSRYLYTSARHQDLAMKGFQLVMPAVTPENCNAVFAFSTLLLVHTLTSQFNEYSSSPPRPGQDLESIRAWIVLLRGCTTVYLSARTSLEAGPFGRRLAEFRVPEVPTDNAYDKRLRRISQTLLTDVEVMEMSSEDEMDTYRASIHQLRLTSAASCNADPLLDYRAIMIVWATRLPDQFLRLFNDRRPPALVIMSYACMLLKRGEGLWFMEGRIDTMLNSLRAELSPEWHWYLDL